MKTLKKIIATIVLFSMFINVFPAVAFADVNIIKGENLFVFEAEDGTRASNESSPEMDYLTQDPSDGSYKITRAIALSASGGFSYTFDIPETGEYVILVKVLQQSQYGYYINMLLDGKSVASGRDDGRYGFGSRRHAYSKDFHWLKLDTETLENGSHTVTVKKNSSAAFDKVMIARSDIAPKGSDSLNDAKATYEFEKNYCPDNRYNVNLKDASGIKKVIAVEKGVLSVPKATEAFNTVSNAVESVTLPLPTEKPHHTAAWEETSLDAEGSVTEINAIYTVKNYTLKVQGDAELTVKQKGEEISPVDGVYTVEALSDVTIINNSDDSAQWYDINGNLVGNEATFTYTPIGNTELYLTAQYVKAGLSEILIGGKPLENFNFMTTSYTVDLAKGLDYPEVSATKYNSESQLTIKQASENNGTALLTVTYGDIKTEYEVKFNKLEYVTSKATLMDKKDGADAIVILVHDDGNYDTAKFMTDQFKEKGLKGSAALISNPMKTSSANTIAMWQKLFDTGVLNVASHSRTHNFWGIDDTEHSVLWTGYNGETETRYFPAGNVTAELKGSQDDLRELFPGQKVLAFCHVGFGFAVIDGKNVQVTDAVYDIMDDYYVGGRGAGTDNTYIWPRNQWYRIGYESDKYDTFNADGTVATSSERYVDTAIDRKGFIFYFWHKIDNSKITNSSQTKQENASELFTYISDKVKAGTVWNPFFEEALQYGREYEDILKNGVAEIRTYNENKKAVYLSDTLNDEMFDYPVTVKVEVDSSWEQVKQVQNNIETVLTPFEENGITYVYAEVIPDKGEATLTKFEAGIKELSDSYVKVDAAEDESNLSLVIAAYNGNTLADTVVKNNVSLEAGVNTIDYTPTANFSSATKKRVFIWKNNLGPLFKAFEK